MKEACINLSICPMKKYLVLLGVAAVACSPFASAGIVHATESIIDARGLDLFDNNFTRERSNDAGYYDLETDHATIRTENQISQSFGIYDNQDVSYAHDVTWFNPPAGSYLSATLTIYAWGALGDDNEVRIEGSFAGTINPTQIFDLGFTSTEFTSNDGSTLDLLLGDGQLFVDIDKNADATIFGFPWDGLRSFSVYGSVLDVEYVAVPEPSALLLLITAGASSLLMLRRRRNA